jgi:hypothetical protein
VGGGDGCERTQTDRANADRKLYDALPERLTIYRGQCRGERPKCSWTLDLERAKWFGQRNALLEAALDGCVAAVRRPERRRESPLLLYESYARIGKDRLRYTLAQCIGK